MTQGTSERRGLAAGPKVREMLGVGLLLACAACSAEHVAANEGTGGTGGTGATPGPECSVGGSGSTLMCADGKPCAHFVVPEQRCSFTQDEVLAGIDISYQIVIDAPVPGVISEPLDTGGCGAPGPSGLIVFEELESTSGGPERYCLCDLGSCPATPPAPLTLEAGSYDRKFHWDGRGFGGPGDSQKQPGDPFPPGLYVLTLRLTGQQELDGGTQAFDLGAGMTLRVE